MKKNWIDLKILIVEDTESSIMFYKSAFKKTGAELLIANNGEQAVEIVKTTPDIDIILMDINMPIMNGIEATRIIKSIRPDISIIIQTAYVLDYSRQESLEAGCSFFLEKPIRLKALYEAIEEQINTK